MDEILTQTQSEPELQIPANNPPIIDQIEEPKNSYKTFFYLFFGLFLVTLMVLVYFLTKPTQSAPINQTQNQTTGNIIPSLTSNITNNCLDSLENNLKDYVFTAVEKSLKIKYAINKNPGYLYWDKKIDISSFDVSTKAAQGKWWQKDAWDWIAWQQDNNTWKVLVSFDGFDCKELESVPIQYNDFFYHITHGSDNKIYCS